MHLGRAGKADRLAHQACGPGAQRQVLPLNVLRVALAQFAQFIRICRWLQLIHKDQLALLKNALFSMLRARKRYRVAQRFRQY
jgi:hypothetical protein